MSTVSREVKIQKTVTPIGERNGLSLAIVSHDRKSIGEVILAPDSAALIETVEVVPMHIFPDDRGFFAELARLGSTGLAEKMVPDGETKVQVSATLNYPGTIKAIHYHFEQTDLWAPVSGMLQIFLCDLRKASPTFGRVNTLYAGRFQPWEILIPPGVAHGYKVVGNDPALLIYITNRFYNQQDEGRLPYDHPQINYDWETQHK